tara:strand:- start:191 stop:424 length:234 start_codon:yes stop_codon:yes gene_type:complete
LSVGGWLADGLFRYSVESRSLLKPHTSPQFKMFNNTYTLKNALLQFSQGGVYKDQGWHRPITQWVSKFTADVSDQKK